MCPKHGNLRCQLSIVLLVDCPEICPESKNMCPKHGNLRCQMKCALRLPWKIKICPETALRAHFALSMENFGGWLMMIRYFFMDIGEIVTWWKFMSALSMNFLEFCERVPWKSVTLWDLPWDCLRAHFVRCKVFSVWGKSEFLDS